MSQNSSSDAVVIGALRVNCFPDVLLLFCSSFIMLHIYEKNVTVINVRELFDSLVNNINLALINLRHHPATFRVYSLYLLSNVRNTYLSSSGSNTAEPVV